MGDTVSSVICPVPNLEYYMIRLFCIFLFLAVVDNSYSQRTIYSALPEPGVVQFEFNIIPLAGILSDSAYLVFSLDEVSTGGEQFFRLWLLYTNTRNGYISLSPTRFARFEVQEPKYGMKERLAARDAQTMWRKVLNAKAVEEINERFGNTVDTIDSQRRPVRLQMPATVDSIPTLWYQNFKWGIHSGILTEINLAPYQSVDGYVYFPFPSNEIIQNNISDREGGKYWASFSLGTTTVQVQFAPVKE